MRMRRPMGWVLSTALVSITATATGFLTPTSHADQFGDGTVAVATGGLVATGGFSAPGGDVFAATFVLPEGITSESPHASGVDFAQPWASLTKTSGGPPGIAQPYPCSVVTNPTTWSAGHPVKSPDYNATGHQPRTGISFDAACDDDGGFDFYRVTWNNQTNPQTGQPEGVYDTRMRLPLVSTWGRAVQQTSGHAGSVTYRSEAAQNADISICGYDGQRFQCLKPTGPGGTGGSIYFASSITVIAG